MMGSTGVILAGFSAAAWALIVGMAAAVLGKSLGLMDHPDQDGGRKRHDRPTPLVGGLGIVPPTLVALIAGMSGVDGPVGSESASLMWIALASLAMFFVGLIDDRFELGARARLVTAIATLAFAMIMAPELSLSFLRFAAIDEAIIPSMPVAVAFTILCMIGFTNAVNMADGKNGIVIGLCLIWTSLLWVSVPATLRAPLMALMVALGVMLFFNWRSRLFLGDSGSYGLATLVGLLVIYVYKRRFADLPADVIAIWFSVPVIDCLRLLTVRVLRGRSPFAGDRDHLHHHLGSLSPNWAVGWSIYMALVAVPSIGATLWPTSSGLWLILIVVVYSLLIFGTSRRFAVAVQR
jgi:UDP-GlcNAc:undecaprenyl-phosphate/decaprenyl-phosphate GlcNAc-1-phosphate transferase